MNKNINEKYQIASLERHRYQPRYDERIAWLPIYLGHEIRDLKKIALEEHWNLNSTSSSYSGNQEPPLYNSNTFYEYLDESLDPNIVSMLIGNLDGMPLHINDDNSWHRAISRWRLKIGK